ncbi:MAG: hydantoinase B/oxoprolinase family protein [Chloroflexota bacterium]
MHLNKPQSKGEVDPISLEIFKHLLAAIPEEMGVVLRKSAYSPNIKERRDFSCALFDARGNMISQAAHIPVHLGSMPLSVRFATEAFRRKGKGDPSFDLEPGDIVVMNDPYRGGTHLPDITFVSPVFIPDGEAQDASRLFGFVASRAHHADVGGISPGSMPLAVEIYQEGLIIPPIKLVAKGEINPSVWELILANVRTPEERRGDLQAQIAANQLGVARLRHLVQRYGAGEIATHMQALLAYTERLTRQYLQSIPNGTYSFTDYLDDDGRQTELIPIQVRVTIQDDEAVVDFTGSASQCAGSVNAVYAITLSAVFYVFRCLLGLDVPNNSGCLAPIRVIAPEGTVVNARPPAPVAGGNVETSQRIVDALLGALTQACPQRIPAASQGTMNNLSFGGWDTFRDRPFAYYETVGGGTGATPGSCGLSGIHSHMTNTLNTPIEALEYGYPLRVECYEIRRGSGGKGYFCGGEGIRRDIRVLVPTEISLLSERRRTQPYGLHGGEPGACGQNVLIRKGNQQTLPGKGSVNLQPDDILSIRTPGGGGYGKAEDHLS